MAAAHVAAFLVFQEIRPGFLSQYRRAKDALLHIEGEKQLLLFITDGHDMADEEAPELILVIGMQEPVSHNVAVGHEHERVVRCHVFPHVVVDALQGPAGADDAPSIEVARGQGGVRRPELPQHLHSIVSLCCDLPGENVLLRGDDDGASEGEVSPQKLVAVETIANDIEGVYEDNYSVIVHGLQEGPIADELVEGAFPLAILAQDLQREGRRLPQQLEVLVGLVRVDHHLHAGHPNGVHRPKQGLTRLLFAHRRARLGRHLPPGVQNCAHGVRHGANAAVRERRLAKGASNALGLADIDAARGERR
mmetsp:Transcript_115652/g.258444  ORF Transcript_115652/g.258444 Transcript_115652/m.258444 type:complete len:307 (+) Transcript_115652:134-1054(+)